MTERIVVIGGGGFGRETLDVIEAINTHAGEARWRLVGVIDDAPADIQVERLRARAVPLLGTVESCREMFANTRYVVGIGNPAIRERIVARIDAWGGKAATLVHPAAVIGTQVRMEPGTVVCGGAQISTNVQLGRHAHINPGVIIGHDAVLQDYVSANPGAIISGEVEVRALTLIGAGSVILQGLSVGRRAVVGAAACVTRSVPDDAIVVGVPAHPHGNREHAE
ncbi:NeuD/PglB/VioB family sugar acetyltransferase [Microbacterium azadirachtae]|uniref:NeuD/PglB/VioB family sugar acetyltransferase n=1 Tax=Microbacterium azadirachtae TaxID=582680 RepID=UPI003F74B3E0